MKSRLISAVVTALLLVSGSVNATYVYNYKE
jgi:hypothetical protein